jgi:hypothetical protein
MRWFLRAYRESGSSIQMMMEKGSAKLRDSSPSSLPATGIEILHPRGGDSALECVDSCHRPAASCFKSVLGPKWLLASLRFSPHRRSNVAESFAQAPKPRPAARATRQSAWRRNCSAARVRPPSNSPVIILPSKMWLLQARLVTPLSKPRSEGYRTTEKLYQHQHPTYREEFCSELDTAAR